MEFHRPERVTHRRHCHRQDKFHCGSIGHRIPSTRNSLSCWPFLGNFSIMTLQRLHWIKVRMANQSIVVSPRAKSIPNVIRLNWMPVIQTMISTTSHAWISFDPHRHQPIDSAHGSNWIKPVHSSTAPSSTAPHRKKLKFCEQVSWFEVHNETRSDV